jgi:hypothetical protein
LIGQEFTIYNWNSTRGQSQAKRLSKALRFFGWEILGNNFILDLSAGLVDKPLIKT